MTAPPNTGRSTTARPNYVAGAAAIVWLAIIGVPLYALIASAFQAQARYASGGPLATPHFTGSNFVTVVHTGFLRDIWQTIEIAVATVAIVLILAVPIAYAVVRGRGWITSGVFRLFLLGLAIPAQAVIIPLFYMINRMGLYDTLWGVILPTAAFSLPVSVLVLTGGMRDISRDMYEAMALDGARPARVLKDLVIPLSRGAIATAGIFAALQAWNGFLFPLIMTQSSSDRTVTLGLYTFVSEYGANVPALLAAVVMSAVPVLVVYLLARRHLVMGLMGAGGK